MAIVLQAGWQPCLHLLVRISVLSTVSPSLDDRSLASLPSPPAGVTFAAWKFRWTGWGPAA